MKTLKIFILTVIFMSYCTLSIAGTIDNLTTEIDKLKTENIALWKTINRLNKENVELKNEIQKSKENTKIEDHPNVDNKSKDVSANCNNTVIKAINKYLEMIDSLNTEGLTDIQYKIKWLETTQKLDKVLQIFGQQVTISYVIKDVEFDQELGIAHLKCASVYIKSSDSEIKDFIFGTFYQFDVNMTEEEASKIIPNSIATIAGMLLTNIDFSKPASEQPKINSNMVLYRPLVVIGKYDTYFDSNVNIMISKDCKIIINGKQKKLLNEKEKYGQINYSTKKTSKK